MWSVNNIYYLVMKLEPGHVEKDLLLHKLPVLFILTSNEVLFESKFIQWMIWSSMKVKRNFAQQESCELKGNPMSCKTVIFVISCLMFKEQPVVV